MEEFGEHRPSPVKDGDRLIDWDQDRGVARNVRGDEAIYFDMYYDNGNVIVGYMWTELSFRLEK